MIDSYVPRVARHRLVAVALGMVLAGGVCGCPSMPRTEGPDAVAVVEAYALALHEGRPEDAHALLHPDALGGLGPRDFAALYRRHRELLVAQADQLVVLARSGPPDGRALVDVGIDRVEMIKTSDGWRLLRPVGAPTGDAAESE